MENDPLTDPSSLIAYRLANSARPARPKPAPGGRAGSAPVGLGALIFGLALAFILGCTLLALR